MRIPNYAMRRIAELWYRGLPRDKIAQIVGVSGSTVSELVGIFPDERNNLRELAVELSKSRLSVPEARNGVHLLGKLAKIGVNPNEVSGFVGASEKMSKNSGYKPELVVRSAMQLSSLEEKSGKSYSAAILDYQTTTYEVEALKEEKQKLDLEICKLKLERKQKLTQGRVTDQEIAYTGSLRLDLRRHGIVLGDIQKLQTYLQNMQETGVDPKKFVKYTKEHGSLRRQTTLLQSKAQRHTLVLQSLQGKEEHAKGAIDAYNARIFELNEKTTQQHQTLLTLQKEAKLEQEEKERVLTKLGLLLRVEPEAKSVVDALGAKQKQLLNLNEEIMQKKDYLQNQQQREEEIEAGIQILEGEIQDKLGINNYVAQLKTGIAALESRTRELQEKIATADTVTNFLLKNSFDFDRLYSYFEVLKRIRAGTSQPAVYTAIVEEEIRNLALKAFDGQLMTKKEQAELLIGQEKQRETITELEAKLEEKTKELGSAKNTIGILEAIKTDFEGRHSTLRELEKWVSSTYHDLIEKRAEEKHDAVAAATAGALDFVSQKVSSLMRKQSKQGNTNND